jgi:hypothetical protein
MSEERDGRASDESERRRGRGTVELGLYAGIERRYVREGRGLLISDGSKRQAEE